MQIACPKCRSHDLYAGKKGFSGKKAVVGAIATGGIGLLAGTLGSNKIWITCLACGNKFRPGSALQAKAVHIPLSKRQEVAASQLEPLDDFDQRLLMTATTMGLIPAMKILTTEKKIPLAESKVYVEGLLASQGIKAKQSTVGGVIVLVVFALIIIAMIKACS